MSSFPKIITTVICALVATACSTASASIKIENHKNKETLRYPMPLLVGSLSDNDSTEIVVVNQTTGKKMQGLAANGQFKALITLAPGENKLVLTSGKDTKKFNINYKPATTPYKVRLVYFTDSSGNTQMFHTATSENPKDFAGRLKTMARTIQTFTAERMGDVDFPKCTFRLEEDQKGEPIVHVIKGDLTMKEYHKMGRGQLYDIIRQELAEKLPGAYAKNIVMPAFSYYNRDDKKNMSYTALGGGNQALFGGSNLFAWPKTVEEIQAAFSNSSILDTDRFSNDSIGRNVFWASMSTCYGALLHELGHAFNLYHIKDPQAIMLRGFDRFSRAFVVEESPDFKNPHYRSFPKDQVAMWNPANAQMLYYDRWFSPEAPTCTNALATTSVYDKDKHQFTVSSPNDIGAVLIGTVDLIHTQFPINHKKKTVKSVVIKVDDYKDILYLPRAMFQIIDRHGNVTYTRMDKFFTKDEDGKIVYVPAEK